MKLTYSYGSGKLGGRRYLPPLVDIGEAYGPPNEDEELSREKND